MNIAAALDTKLLGPIIKVLRLLQIGDSRSPDERHAIESRSFSPSFQISRARFQFSERLYELCAVLIFGPKLASSPPSFSFCFFFIHLLCHSPRSLAEKALKEIHRGKNIFFPSTWKRPNAVSNLFSTDAVRCAATCLKRERKKKEKGKRQRDGRP